MLNSEGKDIKPWELGQAISRRVNSVLTPQEMAFIQDRMANEMSLWFSIIDAHINTTQLAVGVLRELKLNEDMSWSVVNDAFAYAARSGYMCHLPFAANEIVLLYDVQGRLSDSGVRFVTLSDEGEDGTVLIAPTYTSTISRRQYSYRLVRDY